MRPSLQRLLLRTYALAERARLLDGPVGSAVFDRSYRLYKRWLEAPSLSALRAHVRPGSTVIDVGANAGFFVDYFAGWVGPSGRVVAIEPEPRNYARLLRFISRRGLADRVDPIRAAAVESAGQVTLSVDPFHPGGHHLAPTGTPVPAITVDGLGATDVSLIKIDVQGAELRVLLGAEQTLASCHPALLLELDDVALREQRASAAAVLDHLANRGYEGHLILSKRSVVAAARTDLLARSADGRYTDVLFLWRPSPSEAPRAPSPQG